MSRLRNDLSCLWSRYGLRYVDPVTRRVVYALLALFLAETVLYAVAPGVWMSLAWRPIGSGFQPWQPITHLLLTGPSLLSALFGAFMVRFLLPVMFEVLERRTLRAVMASGLVGATLSAGMITVLGLATGTQLGWSSLLGLGIVALGLARPNLEVRLMFLADVRASAMVWAALAIYVILAALAVFGKADSLSAAFGLGGWLGVYGWWSLRGPGARQRHLRNLGSKVARKATHLHVHQGGRHDDRLNRG